MLIKFLPGFGVSGFAGASSAERGACHSVSRLFDSYEFSSLYPWVEGTNVGPLVLVIIY